jgi:hypothetical protein
MHKKIYKFDKTDFKPDELKKDLHYISPKFEKLLENIDKLDQEDFKNDNHYYKHIIYCDLKSSTYGSKMIAASLIANGYINVYNKQLKLNSDLEKNNKNFALLSSLTVFNKPFPVKLRKKIIEIFNRRPDNIYGDNIRFLLLDQGYKEGIDVFDVKYLHIFDDLFTENEQKQVIGRGTRFCGQKGLNFEPNIGWTLNVFRYKLKINEKRLQDKYNEQDFFNLILKKSGLNINKILFSNKLEILTKYGAVDYILTKNIHEFKKEKKDMSSIKISSSISKEENESRIPTIKLQYSNILLNDRISNFNNIVSLLKDVNEYDCLDNTQNLSGKSYIYKIGNNIKIIKKLGEGSYGKVYLADDNNFSFVCKIVPNKPYNLLENDIVNKLSQLVINKINPNFPITYKTIKCDEINNSINYPSNIINQKYFIMINELCNGDLYDFIYNNNNYLNNSEILLNNIQQQILSVFAFHYYTKYIHNDIHMGNFLFLKINPGGYLNYKIFGKNIYVKNLGYLWILWDYGLVKEITNKNDMLYDYENVFLNYIKKNRNGRLYNDIEINNDIYYNILDIYNYIINLYGNSYDNEMTSNMVFEYLLSKNIFFEKIPENEKIININPYIIY